MPCLGFWNTIVELLKINLIARACVRFARVRAQKKCAANLLALRVNEKLPAGEGSKGRGISGYFPSLFLIAALAANWRVYKVAFVVVFSGIGGGRYGGRHRQGPPSAFTICVKLYTICVKL